MQGLDVRPSSMDVGSVEDVAGSSSSAAIADVLPTVGMVKMRKLMH